MLLTGKSRVFFVEFNEYATLIASASGPEVPLTVEQIKELPAGPVASALPGIDELAGGRRGGGYRRAVCGIYPDRRFVRRATLDLKKVKEPAYLNEMLATQFRAEPDKMTLALLAAADGRVLDPSNPGTKDVLFCGSYSEDFIQTQAALLEAGLYPERLEVGSLSVVGSIVSILALQETKTPTLVLELGRETTHCYIANSVGVDLARPVPHGINSMIPVVHKELGLKDEEAAAKLLFSNTFDFTGMGPVLVKRLLKELQSSIGFYEVQTGQSIGQLVCTALPSNLNWLAGTLSSSLGVGVAELKLGPWLEKQKIKVADAAADKVSVATLGLLSLMARHQPGTTENEGK